ncbi:MAG: hypothetical protein V1783_02410 [Bacteroidota bacterium]
MRRNFLFFILVIVTSLVSAPYLGVWYDQISIQYGGWMTSKKDAVYFAGLLVSYVFFIPLLYGIFGIRKNKNWIIWTLLPVLLLWFGADKYHIYIPVLLIIAALFIAKLLNLLISKLKRPNPPMVIK